MSQIPADAAADARGRPLPAGPLVLLVEDDPINRAVVARQLQRLGYRHALAEDGEQAWRVLAEDGIDLVLTDCRMPVLDGYALARRIRAGERGGRRRMPIVALSASDPPDHARRCAECGMDGVLGKPVRLHALGRELHRLLGCAAPAIPGRPPPSRVPGPVHLDVLTEAFGSPCDAHAVLRDLREACRRDLAALDAAVERGDRPAQQELLHRIAGSLRLLDDGPLPDAAGDADPARRRDALRRRMERLDALLDGLGPHGGTTAGPG